MMTLVKLFFFMRAFNSFTYLVIMVKNVITELTNFLIIFTTFVMYLSLCLGVMGFQNYSAESEEDQIEIKGISI